MHPVQHRMRMNNKISFHFTTVSFCFNPLQCRGNFIATSNNMKLVHWPQPAQAPPRCIKCNSPPINGQCTNHRMVVRWFAVLVWPLKG